MLQGETQCSRAQRAFCAQEREPLHLGYVAQSLGLALGLRLIVLNLRHLTAGAASLWFCCSNSPPLLFYFPFSPTIINFFLCSILSCLLALSEADTTHSVVGESFQLSTERRAKERLEFEQALKEKELLRVQMEERQAREQEEREKEEIARLRQEQVHWSNCNYGVLNV